MSLAQVYEDAVVLRGMVDYIKTSAEPPTTNELAMTQHASAKTAARLCKKLQQKGIIEHATVPRAILGVTQQVPQAGWQLTQAFILSDYVFDAEALARGA